ncbi:SpoIIE family protein phosphatase [Haliangium ochraceum]|uniref:SpoIIE family protein phosphatase n=1 Tax=Haliangium ochraceum TaxID=80816 RepID=UPI00019BB179|nr:SpoIIE family protein phosphatase [Haliangium ochraceum]
MIFLAGPNAGRRYKLHREGDYIIGRRSDCQIFIPDMRVSRQHARIHEEQGAWVLEDLGSNNGTFLNGERVQSAKLKNQDEISIATNSIRVEVPKGTKPLAQQDSHVTIVDVKNPAIYVSTEDAEAAMTNSASFPWDPRNKERLLTRKLHAVQTILETAANIADPDLLLESVVAQLLEVFPQADSVGVLVEDEDSHELLVKCHKTRKKQGFSADLKVPGTIIDHVVHDRRGILLSESGHDAREDGDLAGRTSVPPNGSRMGAPLQARNVHYGVIYVECTTGTFQQEDLDLLTSIAAQTGLAIYTARMHNQMQHRQRLERDLRVARQIQRSLMRSPPRVLGLDFAIHYEPAYQIGGDFFDFIWKDDNHLTLIVGDVAGKAISAALYMARLTSELRGRAGIARSPQRLIKRVNEEMVKLGDDGMFATLVCAVFELSTRSLLFTNAGHCVPLLRRGEQVFPLESERAHIPPIGILPDLEVGEARVQLHTGDLLVIVSDGIVEARDPNGNEYGERRLIRRIRTARGGAEDLVKSILQDVDSHVGSATQADDMTILVMHVAERRTRRQTTTVPGGVPHVGGEIAGGDSADDEEAEEK